MFRSSLLHRRFAYALLLLMIVGLTGQPVYADPTATLTVDTTTDTNAPAFQLCTVAPNDCSLRGAISNANTVAGADTIVIPAATYTLSIAGAGENANATGDLDILDSVTFQGAGMSVAIVDGADLDRIFDIVPFVSGSRAVVFRDMTIQNGSTPASGLAFLNQGGAIAFRAAGGQAGVASINLVEVRVLNNVSGNSSGGGISMVRGMALTSNPSLSIQNSTIAGNTALLVGGGVACTSCNLDIGNSTISNNEAQQDGTGANVGGGGLWVSGTTGVGNVIASTISSNRTNGNGGGVLLDQGNSLSLDFVTVANNRADLDNDNQGDGGGISHNTSTFNLRNSIVADNADGTGTVNPDCFGSISSQNYNLIENVTGCTFTGTTTNNITGTDPQLLALANNGGPSNPPNQTHAIQPTSPVLNSIPNGTNGCVGGTTRDERGAIRAGGTGQGGTACERGAYELSSDPLAVDLASFEAAAQDADVRVTWETVQETDNAGFNLYRSLNPDDGGSLLNSELIPSQAPGGGGASYAYTDATVAPGTTYYYWLESVATNGATERYGPVSATTNTPTAVILTGLDVGDVLPFGWAIAGVIGVAMLGGVVWRKRVAAG